jgi:Fe-S oxidoreductase
MEAVREDLEPYLRKSRVGITGANAIAAEEGAALILHNEGNVTRVRTRSQHIILASIDKIYPRVEDAILMLRLETYLATGSIFPSFIDIVAGRSKSSDIEKTPFYGMHDPSLLLLILLDNGRRRLLEEKRDFADLLYCIGCGNCLLDCPTYNTVGSYFGTDGMLGARGVALSCLQGGLEIGIEDGLFLCTTCGLCGEVCPVGIDGGKRLKDLRRSALSSPEIAPKLDELTQLETTIDQHGTPYGPTVKADFPVSRREAPCILYIGCVGRSTEVDTAAASIKLLQQLGVDFSVIDEVCCEAVKEEVGSCPNPEHMKQNIENIKRAKAQRVLFICPTCLKTFVEYDKKEPTGLVFETLTSYLDRKFTFARTETDPSTMTYHDPCHLGRGMGSFDSTRNLIKGLESTFVEMDHHHQESLCCGAGGGVRGFFPKFSRDIARRRVKEAEEVKADVLLTDCLSCKHNLKQGVPWEGKTKVMTTPEYLLERINAGKIQVSRKMS